MKRFTTALWVFLLVAGFGTTSTAETLFEAEVNDQIDAISSEFRQSGYVKLGETWVDDLSEGDDMYVELEMFQDYEYIAVGVCDNDCGDIDLLIFDARDREVASDISDDDVPVLHGSPDYDGTYFLEAQMHDCNTRTCAFGVAIYARR